MTTSISAATEPTSGGNNEDYYDIMILGKTGMGKSTTTDKILLANPTGDDYDYDATAEDNATTHQIVPDDTQEECDSAPEASSDRNKGEEGAGSREQVSTIKAATKYSDLSMWHLSRDQDIRRVTTRLKNLVFWRSLGEPHKQVNEEREKSVSTKSCELLSNDTSKIRVLDVPGFYGPDDDDSSDSDDYDHPPEMSEPPGSLESASIFDVNEGGLQTDLAIMRKILHIKVATNFKFNRIVYFLPESGVPTRASRNLKTELQIMERYFKRTVFESMVVVATQNRSVYRFAREGCELFTADDMKKTRNVFRKAMRKVFQGSEAPNPPIIFISLDDTCDGVLRKIQEASVIKEGVGLTFNPSTCARCGIYIGKLAEPTDVKKVESINDLAITINKPGSVAIPYSESTCHPRFIPKYSRVQCIVGGIVHLITFKQFIHQKKWPYFGDEDEVCIGCNQPPKSRGCLRVGTEFTHKRSQGSITVNHTSDVNEDYVFVLDEHDAVPRMRYGSERLESQEDGSRSPSPETQDTPPSNEDGHTEYSTL